MRFIVFLVDTNRKQGERVKKEIEQINRKELENESA